MALLNSNSPPEDPRSGLGRRVAEGRARRESSQSRTRLKGYATWDPAEALGVSPRLMTIAVAIVGLSLGVLAFQASRAPSRAEVAEAAQTELEAEVYIQPEIEVAAPSAPSPRDAVADYYLLLRQGMYEVAWNRTAAEFQGANYPGGFNDFVRAWTGHAEIEVLSSEVESQDQDEARLVVELQDTGSGTIFRSEYRLRFDAATGFWLIVSVTSA